MRRLKRRLFLAVWRPTMLVGRAVQWLAEGYRAGTPLERVLIFPSWAILRGVFLVGWGLSMAVKS